MGYRCLLVVLSGGKYYSVYTDTGLPTNIGLMILNCLRNNLAKLNDCNDLKFIFEQSCYRKGRVFDHEQIDVHHEHVASFSNVEWMYTIDLKTMIIRCKKM